MNYEDIIILWSIPIVRQTSSMYYLGFLPSNMLIFSSSVAWKYFQSIQDFQQNRFFFYRVMWIESTRLEQCRMLRIKNKVYQYFIILCSSAKVAAFRSMQKIDILCPLFSPTWEWGACMEHYKNREFIVQLQCLSN